MLRGRSFNARNAKDAKILSKRLGVLRVLGVNKGVLAHGPYRKPTGTPNVKHLLRGLLLNARNAKDAKIL
jgi:hypothetical protein